MYQKHCWMSDKQLDPDQTPLSAQACLFEYLW